MGTCRLDVTELVVWQQHQLLLMMIMMMIVMMIMMMVVMMVMMMMEGAQALEEANGKVTDGYYKDSNCTDEQERAKLPSVFHGGDCFCVE
mmetsp:Transcript_55997/g.111259  ORF Transcript_55997/g.111259 Transcript_55997/m.111259 type:complete len:90 (-) Transcript_55997:30-299(-)